MEDYSNFSWEAVQKSFKEMVDEIQKKTGATDEQMGLALSVAAEKFMGVNFFKEKGPTFIWFCERCKMEYEWEIAKLPHSSSDASSCLACNVEPGQRVPFNSLNCPGCKVLDNGAGI